MEPDFLGDVLASDADAGAGAGYTSVEDVLDDNAPAEQEYGVAPDDEDDDEEDASVLKFGRGESVHCG